MNSYPNSPDLPISLSLTSSHSELLTLYNRLSNMQAQIDLQGYEHAKIWQDLADINTRIYHEAELSRQI